MKLEGQEVFTMGGRQAIISTLVISLIVLALNIIRGNDVGWLDIPVILVLAHLIVRLTAVIEQGVSSRWRRQRTSRSP